jgi:ChrR Cupin-like domain
VIDGVFQNEPGDYPARSYVRNLPASRHTPGYAPGCVLFVKLWQFDLEDRTSAHREPPALAYTRTEGWPVKSRGSPVTAARRYGWNSGSQMPRLRSISRTAANLVLGHAFDERGEGFARQILATASPAGRLCATTGTDGSAVGSKLALRAGDPKVALLARVKTRREPFIELGDSIRWPPSESTAGPGRMR